MRAAIIVRGRQSGQFWVRAFQLEQMVEHARAEVMRSAKSADENCVMPILTTYALDAEFTWFCAFALFVDALGVIDAHGAVFFSDLEHLHEVRADAQKAGEVIMRDLVKHGVEIRETIAYKGGEK